MKAKAIVDNQMGLRITSPLFEETNSLLYKDGTLETNVGPEELNNCKKRHSLLQRMPLFLCVLIRSEILGQLNHTGVSRMQFVIDAAAIRERNILIPFASDQLLRLFLRFQVDKPPDVMIFIEKVSDFKFFHKNHPLS